MRSDGSAESLRTFVIFFYFLRTNRFALFACVFCAPRACRHGGRRVNSVYVNARRNGQTEWSRPHHAERPRLVRLCSCSLCSSAVSVRAVQYPEVCFSSRTRVTAMNDCCVCARSLIVSSLASHVPLRADSIRDHGSAGTVVQRAWTQRIPAVSGAHAHARLIYAASGSAYSFALLSLTSVSLSALSFSSSASIDFTQRLVGCVASILTDHYAARVGAK